MKQRSSFLWDYALAALAGSLAVYSAGMGLMSVELGLFFASIIVVGSVFSAAIQRRLASSKVLSLAGPLYAAAAVVSVFNADALNGLAPAGGFPSDTHLAAMGWMLALGSFFAWTESVLVFQAVPCIAIFGLVGTWDTFRGTPFTFFGFLLCMTALLSRAHNREMLRQARESGFPAMSRIWNGPWKWMAGPQWALVSATAIVLVALVGAPFVQMSVSSVAGHMHVSLPAVVQQARQAMRDSIGNNRGPSAAIGAGPLHPGDVVVLAAKLDRPRYLRDDSYDQYGGHAWTHDPSNDPSAMLPGERIWQVGRIFRRISLAQKVMKNPVKVHFSLEVLNGIFETLPVPGEVTQIVVPERYADSSGMMVSRSLPGSAVFEGDTLVPSPDVQPRDAYRNLPAPYDGLLTDPGPSAKVARLARETAAGMKTDYEKAVAIKAKIENTAVYNLATPAIPADADPVEYFLFTSKEGYCDLFASSMVLMARAVGIPARYATGYYPFKNEKDSQGRTLLRTSERHAWAELFFKDVGWVPFDATEGAIEVDGYGRGSTGEGVSWYRGPVATAILDSLIVAAAVGAIWFLAAPAFRRFRRSRNPGKADASESRRRMGVLYAGLVRDIERLTGIRKDSAQTASEYHATTLGSLGEAGEMVGAATLALERCLYSPREIGADDVAEFAAGVKGARRAVRAGTRPIWHTAWAFVRGVPKTAIAGLRTLNLLRGEDHKA